MMPHTPLPMATPGSDESPPNLSKTTIALVGQSAQIMKLASMHGKLASDVEINQFANQVGIHQTYTDADESFGSVWTAIRGIDQKLTTIGGQLTSLRVDFDSFVESCKKDTPTQLKRKSTHALT